MSCNTSRASVDPANETLPSSLSNFITDFYGDLTKTVVDGRVVWELPCDLDSGLPANPRLDGEGLACYFLRLADETVYGVPTTREVNGANGVLGGGDLGEDRTLTLDVNYASKAILPAYDAAQYGVVTGDADLASDNSSALAALTILARASGRGIQLPPGKVFIASPWDVSAVTEVRGWGTGGPPIQTEIITTVAGSNAITNVTSGTRLTSFGIRPRFLRWVKTDSTSVAISTAAFQNDIVLEDIIITGFSRGVDAYTFDAAFNRVSMIGCAKPLRIRSAGTQNLVTRVSCRGSIQAVLADSTTDARVTCASYTAGSTTFTVTDGTAFTVGDLIWVESTSSYANPISAKLWWRRVTNVAGNVITISNPWHFSFSNASFFIGLGVGGNAVETETQCVFSNLNLEWGVWDSPVKCTGPGTVAFEGLHIEGWCVYGPGTERVMLDNANCIVNASYINAWNCTVLDTTGVSLFGSTGGYQIQSLYVRDWDHFQATKLLYVAKSLSNKHQENVNINALKTLGTPVVTQPLTLSVTEDRQSLYQAGENTRLVDSCGVERRSFHGYSLVPATGSFLKGDRVELPTGTLVCDTSGSFRTPVGNGKIRSGSSVYVIDNTARGFLSVRLPVTLGGVQYAVMQVTQSVTPSATTLSSAALAGDRKIELTSVSALSTGDWLVLDFAGTFEDVQIQRIYNNTVFLTLPLTLPHIIGSSVEVGYKLSAASAVDVLVMTPVAVTAPTFYSDSGAVSIKSGLTVGGASVLGNSSLGNAAQIIGNAGGARVLRLTRPGVGDVGIGVGSASFVFWDEAAAESVAILSGGGTDYSLYMGSAAPSAAPRPGYFRGQVASGTDTKGGDMIVAAGKGTGAGTRSTVQIQVPAQTTSGTTAQGLILAAYFDAPQTTPDVSAMLLAIWDGSGWTSKRVQVGAADSGGVGFRILRVVN